MSMSAIETLLFGKFYVDTDTSFVFEEVESDMELFDCVENYETVELLSQNSSEEQCMDTALPVDTAQLVETANRPKTKRFVSLDDDEIDDLVSSSVSKGTKKMTKWGVNQFKLWLVENNSSEEFENLEPAQLNTKLRKFYAEVRNTDGLQYSKSTFVGIRASINRHIRAAPFNRSLTIMTDTVFHTSNQTFNSILKNMKKDGLDKTKHYPSINPSDMAKIRSSLNTNTPQSLQQKVWFDLALAFARRGQENIVQLTTTSYQVCTDGDGKEYVELSYNEQTKNHQGDRTDDDTSKPRMYATKSTTCPVASFKLYLSKLSPNSARLFQAPKKTFNPLEEEWYTGRPVGEKKIGNMMKTLSKQAGLSKSYTNHSIRATTITMLSHAGVEGREIMKISGHRSEKGLASYSTDSSVVQKEKYSAILQGVPEEKRPMN